jgi:hypothetical protein
MSYTDESDVDVAVTALLGFDPHPSTHGAWAVSVSRALDAVAPAIAARAKAEAVADLADRLERARDALNTKARDERSHGEQCRLDGKANGVALALSYVREIERGAL